MNHLLAGLLLLVLYGCSDTPGSAVAAVDSATGIPVTVTMPRQQPSDSVLTALGSVEGIQHPTVSAETSGQIVSIAADEGESVVAGQLLATIDSTLHAIEAATATAQLQRQEILLESQRRDVARLGQLAKTRSISEDRLEDEQAQLEILTAERDVAQKKKEQALYLESRTRVRAPHDGVISRRHISQGDYVIDGHPLFTLVSVGTLRARLAFPEHDAAAIATGKQVVLASPVAPQTSAIGKVTSINPQINPGSRSLSVIVEFDNPGGWYPGASVDATLVTEHKPDSLTVPTLSVVQRSNGPVVFVLAGHSASRRGVQLGQQGSDWVEIIDGLTADDQVIVEGAALVEEGSAVRVGQYGTTR